MSKTDLILDNITCKRGHKTLFSDLSMTIAKGDLIQITGLNGSGKTSLMRIIAGLLPAQAGEITWCGENIHGNDPKSYQKRIRMICPQTPLKNNLTLRENLTFWAQVYGQKDTKTVTEAMSKMAISNLADLSFQVLSSGQKAKANLARLWLSSADIWLLDEAFNAFDQESCHVICQDILAFCQSGGIVLFTSHFDLPLNAKAKKLALSA